MKRNFKLSALLLLVSCIMFTTISFASDLPGLNITPDKSAVVNDLNTAYDKIQPILITDVNGNMLNMESLLKNMSDEDITITLHNPYFNYIIFDENGAQVYNLSEQNGIYLPYIRDQLIYSGQEFSTKCSLDLSSKKLVPGKVYKIVFYDSFEVKADGKMYQLSDTAYFRMPQILKVQ